MKRAKLDKTHTPSSLVAPQDAELEEEMDDIDVVEVDVKVEGEEANTKVERERWSVVWNYFKRLPIGPDGRERAECMRCSKRYISETKIGTGSLKNHIKKCPRRDKNDVAQMLFSKSGGGMSIKSMVFKPERFRELVSQAIIKHNLPFMFVEYEGIRDIFQYLNENVITIFRNTAKSDVTNLFKREKVRLKTLLESLPGRVSLTSDLWTSINTDGFLCVTCHFIDTEWKLQKRILNFQHMPPPHNGVCLTEKISSLLSDWGIEKKLFTITLDNASSNDTFVNFLKGQLSNEGALRSNGDYFHIRCCAHVLNLVVQDGLKAIDEGIVKVRESVKYIKGSQARKQKFIDCVKHVNLNPKKGLRQDVPTRWNATYLMIESAIFYRRAFFRLALSDSNYLDCPNNDEWSKLERIFRFLEEFKTYESSESVLSQKSQLEMYLDEPRSDIGEDLDVLSFWKAHQYRYPELALMARDILSIPVSTVASESAFSNGGRVLDQYRSSLDHDIVEALICSKDWLFGIKGDEELCLQELTDDIMEEENKK